MGEGSLKYIDKGASFSDCGEYRYSLWRIWDHDKPLVMCVGLNPSTADHEKDNPTIRIVSKMTKKLDYGGFYMTNLFAKITPIPEELFSCKDPIGDNDRILKKLEKECFNTIVAWGNFKKAKERSKEVLKELNRPLCFGFNKNLTPVHPMGIFYKGHSNKPSLYTFPK